MGSIYNLNVEERWFNAIVDGNKTVEGRLNKNFLKNIKVNDYIVFECNKIFTFRMLVKCITYYRSFEEYLICEGLERTLPGIKTLEDGISVYREYYSKENEEKIWYHCY